MYCCVVCSKFVLKLKKNMSVITLNSVRSVSHSLRRYNPFGYKDVQELRLDGNYKFGIGRGGHHHRIQRIHTNGRNYANPKAVKAAKCQQAKIQDVLSARLASSFELSEFDTLKEARNARRSKNRAKR